MPQQAVYELAEACLGLAPEMQWSVDEEIARRESKRLFDRLHNGTTSPEAATEVFLLTMVSKLKHTTSVIEERYNRVLASLTHDQQTACPALNEFFEFFTGVAQAADYSLSETIARAELGPLFQACHVGTLSAQDCQDAVFDNMTAKRDTTLTSLQGSVQRLNDQVHALSMTKAESDDS